MSAATIAFGALVVGRALFARHRTLGAKRKTSFRKAVVNLRTRGFAFGGLGVVPRALTESALAEVQLQYKQAGEHKEINTPERRRDFYLKWAGATRSVVELVIREWAAAEHSPLHNQFGINVSAQIVELSCLVSLPSAAAQVWHCDHTDGGVGDLVSFGVPLVDITRDMGPLEVGDGEFCNLANFVERVMSKKGAPTVLGVAKRGHVFAWDNFVRHRASANTSTKVRWVLYFSVLFVPEMPSVGGGSLLSEYGFSLGSIAKILQSAELEGRRTDAKKLRK